MNCDYFPSPVTELSWVETTPNCIADSRAISHSVSQFVSLSCLQGRRSHLLLLLGLVLLLLLLLLMVLSVFTVNGWVCAKALNLYASVSCQSHLQTVTHASVQTAASWQTGKLATGKVSEWAQEAARRQHINLCQREGYPHGCGALPLPFPRKQEEESGEKRQTLTGISNAKKLLYNGVRKWKLLQPKKKRKYMK